MNIKRALFDAYGGFADKRIRKLDSGSLFIVDDRSPSDHGADRQLYPWFCSIFVDVASDSSVKVTMRGGIPYGDVVENWISANREDLAVSGESSLTFTVHKGQQGKLVELASAILAIVAPGKRYQVSAYKYVCPRTASALKKLADVLERAWA